MTSTTYKQAANQLCPDFELKRKECPCESCSFILSELHYMWLEENYSEARFEFEIDQDLHPTID